MAQSICLVEGFNSRGRTSLQVQGLKKSSSRKTGMFYVSFQVGVCRPGGFSGRCGFVGCGRGWDGCCMVVGSAGACAGVGPMQKLYQEPMSILYIMVKFGKVSIYVILSL